MSLGFFMMTAAIKAPIRPISLITRLNWHGTIWPNLSKPSQMYANRLVGTLLANKPIELNNTE